MRLTRLILAGSAAALLAGCANGGPFNRERPDEFAAALQALFGGPQPRSAVEQSMLREAGVEEAALGARSVAGDPQTHVVNRGALVQTMLELPQGDGQEASVQAPE